MLLVHRPRYDDWSLPKGKADAGESDGADRAARGRGGDRPALHARRARRDETRYRDSKGRAKVVHYWLMEPESDERPPTARSSPTDEVDAVRWCTVAEAAERLQLRPRPQAAGQGAGPVVTVYLVRHARAGVPQRLEGRRRAAAAVEGRARRRPTASPSVLVERKPIDLIVSEPVRPLRRHRRAAGREARPRRSSIADALAEGARVTDALRLVEKCATATRCCARTAT